MADQGHCKTPMAWGCQTPAPAQDMLRKLSSILPCFLPLLPKQTARHRASKLLFLFLEVTFPFETCCRVRDSCSLIQLQQVPAVSKAQTHNSDCSIQPHAHSSTW
jgi:hypothetical protein